MSEINSNLYPIQVARALMSMRKLSVHDISDRADIPLDTTEAFLGGFTTVISDRSMANLFSELGVKVDGLDRDRVHFWSMEFSRAKNKKNLMPLFTLMNLIGPHTAMTLNKKRGVTPVLIKGEEIRIVIFVKTPYFTRIAPEDLGLTPGAFDGQKNINDITPYYENLIFEQKLRTKYFDLILSGDFRDESIELLRMVALEFNVTISDLVEYVTKAGQGIPTDEPIIEDFFAGSNVYQFINRKASAQ